jgi:hypothetical protein
MPADLAPGGPGAGERLDNEILGGPPAARAGQHGPEATILANA